MSDFNDREQWKDFLAEFSQRNWSRPARLEQFGRGEVTEEDQLSLLEAVTVELHGPDSPRIVITRRDQTSSDKHKLTDTVTHVRNISPQLDQDGSETGLKIEGENNLATILRLQSLLDGDS